MHRIDATGSQLKAEILIMGV